MKSQGLVKFLFVFLAVAAIGCMNNSKSGSEISETETDQTAEKEEAVEEIIGYPIPTSYEVTTLLKSAGASYIFDINNSPQNVEKYVSLKDKAVNLGIYGADLSYASTYNFNDETMDFLKVSKELIDELQIASAFNESFVSRVEENLENNDSLISIITDSFYETYSYLRKNDQDVTSVLVVAGSWLESVYLTSQIIIAANNKDPFIMILTNQKSSLDKLIKLMEPVKDEAGVAVIYTQLLEIEKTYNEFGDPVTLEQISRLTRQIENLRESLV